MLLAGVTLSESKVASVVGMLMMYALTISPHAASRNFGIIQSNQNWHSAMKPKSSKRDKPLNRLALVKAELQKPSLLGCMEGQLNELANLPPEYSVFNFDDVSPTYDRKGRVIDF